MDDAGFYLMKKSDSNSFLSTFGGILIKSLPWVIKGLSVLGTIALVLVSGGIFHHNIEYIHHFIPQNIPSVLSEFIVGFTFGLITVLLIKTLGFVVDKLTKALALGIVSRFLGGIFGLLKVLVIFSFLLFVITDYNLVDKKTKNDSVLFKPLVDVAAIITPQLKKHQSILDKVNKEAEKAKEKIDEKSSPE